MSQQEPIIVTYDDLPLYCPGEKSPISPADSFGGHPRVFLPIEKTGRAKCPYCGAEYVLENWDPNRSAH